MEGRLRRSAPAQHRRCHAGRVQSGGLCEVAGGRVRRFGLRPHISRIERRRGPVSRYGESAGRSCFSRRCLHCEVWQEETVERFEGAAAGIWAPFGGVTMRRSRPKRGGGKRRWQGASAPVAQRVGGGGRSRSGRDLIL
jgi:hypothetical protein